MIYYSNDHRCMNLAPWHCVLTGLVADLKRNSRINTLLFLFRSIYPTPPLVETTYLRYARRSFKTYSFTGYHYVGEIRGGGEGGDFDPAGRQTFPRKSPPAMSGDDLPVNIQGSKPGIRLLHATQDVPLNDT